MSLEHLLSSWKKDPLTAPNIPVWRSTPARPADLRPFPPDLPPELADALEKRGINSLYSHQVEAWGHTRQGENVVLATGTASGKTLGYNLPVISSLFENPEARALYFFPTKALTQDQLSALEGLLSALTMSSIDGFPRIAIVDDEPDARRLIRRILQTQGNYTLFEATNGKEAIELVNKEHPDLIILDLMMPELDGFSVMDALQKKPETAEIPIIVVTAKELTLNEKSRLQGHIQGLMQKGDFLNDGLLDEVKSLLR